MCEHSNWFTIKDTFWNVFAIFRKSHVPWWKSTYGTDHVCQIINKYMWCYHAASDSDLECHLASLTPSWGEVLGLSSLTEQWYRALAASKVSSKWQSYGCLQSVMDASGRNQVNCTPSLWHLAKEAELSDYPPIKGSGCIPAMLLWSVPTSGIMTSPQRSIKGDASLNSRHFSLGLCGEHIVGGSGM